MLAWGIAVFVVVAAGFMLLTLRLSLEGERAMAQSDREFDQGHLRESLLFARRAARLNAPGLAHVVRANARLDAIAAGAEAADRSDIAVLAWQAIRSVERQHSFWTGRSTGRLKLANERLALLLADDRRRSPSMSQVQMDSRKVLAALQHGERQGQASSVGALGLIVAGLFASYLGLRQRPNPSALWLWGGVGMSGAGAIAWAILLSLP